MEQTMSPVARIWNLVRLDRTDITTVYIYALFYGLIQLSLPLGIQAIIGFVLGGTMSVSLVLLITLVVVGVLCTGLLQIGQKKVIEKIQQKIFVRYAFLFADRIPRLDLKQVDDYYLPELVNRFFEAPSLQKGISKLLLDLPAATIQILFGLLLLCFYHPAFIFFGIFLVLLLWLILRVTGSSGLSTSLAESRYKYALVAWFEEMARMIKPFKFSRNTGIHLRKSDERVIGYLDARNQHFNILLMQYRTLVAFKVLITAAMLIVGSILLVNQQLNIGQFIAAEIIIILIINSVEKIIINLDSVYDVLTSVEKISKLADKPLETAGTLPLQTNSGIGIVVKNLSFGYKEDRLIIRRVDFSLRAGEKACIAGREGTGKSTLLRLLTGAYSGFDGTILFNGIPIGNYALESLRAQIGIVLHQDDIFSGTLWENMTMGSEEVDLAFVNELVEKTRLSAYVSSLKQGFDTELDTTGKRLPRNVVQKVLLIRALLHRPKLLLLEEPWQGMEEQHRTSIQNLLLNDLPGTTVIVASTDEHFARRCHQVIHLTT